MHYMLTVNTKCLDIKSLASYGVTVLNINLSVDQNFSYALQLDFE